MNKSEFLNMQKQVKNAKRSRTPRSAKYKNQKIECDGLKFDSKKEAQRYKVLRDMQRDDVIGELQYGHYLHNHQTNKAHTVGFILSLCLTRTVFPIAPRQAVTRSTILIPIQTFPT